MLAFCAAVLGLAALIIVLSTGMVGINFLLGFIGLGTAGFVVFGKLARGLAIAIFTGILIVGFFAVIAARNGGLGWFAAEFELVLLWFMLFVVGPVALACVVTAVQRRASR